MIIIAAAAGVILIALILFIVLRLHSGSSGVTVNTAKVGRGRVAEYIECTGTAAAGASANVVSETAGVVQTVHVVEGAEVTAGDILFTIEQTENPALTQAQAELDRLNGEYQQQLLTLTEQNNASDKTVQTRRTELQRAIAARNAAAVTAAEEASLTDARSKLAEISSSIAMLDSELFDLKVQVAMVRTPEEIAAAIAELEQEKQTLENRIVALRTEVEVSGTSADLNTLEQRMKNAENQVNSAQTALERAAETLTERQTALSNAESANDYRVLVNLTIYTMEQEGKDPSDSAAFAAAMKSEASMRGGVYSTAYNAVQTAQKNYDNAKTEYDSALEKYEQAVAAFETARSNYEEKQNGVDRVAALKEELAAAEARAAEIDETIPQAQKLLEQAKTDQENYAGVYRQIQDKEDQRASLVSQQNALNKTISDINAKKNNYTALAEAAQTAQQRLNAAIRASSSNQSNAELDALQEQVEQQEAVVAQCSQQPLEVSEVRAEAPGTVQSVQVSAGEETVSGAVLAVLSTAQESSDVDVSVADDQAARVKAGDAAETADGIAAVLTEVADDPSGDEGKKLLRYRLDGAMEAGGQVTLTIGLGKTAYDMVIPVSALREDHDGRCVLVVLTKNAPLGVEYYAARVTVEVLAEDGENAAVSGLLVDDRVILDEDVQDGDRVSVEQQ